MTKITNTQIERIINRLPINIIELTKYQTLYEEKMKNELQQIKSLDSLNVAREIKEKKEQELKQTSIILIEIEVKIVEIVEGMIKENNIKRNSKKEFITELGLNAHKFKKTQNVRKHIKKIEPFVNELIKERRNVSPDNLNEKLYNIKYNKNHREYKPLNKNKEKKY